MQPVSIWKPSDADIVHLRAECERIDWTDGVFNRVEKADGFANAGKTKVGVKGSRSGVIVGPHDQVPTWGNDGFRRESLEPTTRQLGGHFDLHSTIWLTFRFG